MIRRFGQELRYAELHYAPFGKGLSRLWQPWPEVYLDIPHRVTLGQPLPLLAAWADAHRFPCTLESFSCQLVSPSGRILHKALDEIGSIPLDERQGGAVLTQFELDEAGEWQIWVDAQARSLSGTQRFRNQLAKAFEGEWPLIVRVESEPLPRMEGLMAGDPHVHSAGTFDMIEFGPPPDLLLAAARALELDWFALTDHSYDLDDALDDVRRQDPALPRWQAQQDWIRTRNPETDPLVIPGEELSIEGLGGGILHLLLLAPDQFYFGSADGGESALRRKSEWQLPALLERLRDTGCLPVSAHTCEEPGLGERLVLGRRRWEAADMRLLSCQQILSAAANQDFRDGLGISLDLMRQGLSQSWLAGNDSHGHFSIGRSIRWPGRSVSQGRGQLFGRFRSMVLARPDQDRLQQAVLEECAAGRVLLSTGPLLSFEDHSGQRAFGGAWQGAGELELQARLTAHQPEGFLRVFREDQGQEKLIFEQPVSRDATLKLEMPTRGWLRAELDCGTEEAYTNPLLP
jgi:hypothetical protein